MNSKNDNTKRHDPSFYRSIIREKKSKKGRHPSELIDDARTISDPYYVSLSLFRLSDDSRINYSDAKKIAKEAVELASEEKRLWRRGELYSKLAKHAQNWRGKKAEKQQNIFLDNILKKISCFPKGKDLSQSIHKISKYVGCQRIEKLLENAVFNDGFILDDSKNVIRQWGLKCNKNIDPEKIFNVLKKVEDGFIRGKLYGYLYIQCDKKSIEFKPAFEKAVETFKNEKDEKKLSGFRYLSRHISSKKDFIFLKDVIFNFSNNKLKADLLTTLAGAADKKGFHDLSEQLFKESKKTSISIEDKKEKNRVKLKIAKGFFKIDQKNEAKKILTELNKSVDDDKLQNKVQRTLSKYGFEGNGLKNKMSEESQVKSKQNFLSSSGFVLGLYDAYEGAVKPVHFRAVARAAPLCLAFGLDLGLIGFPINDLKSFIKKAENETNIGNQGRYLRYLFDEKRIHFFECSKNNMPIFSENDLVVSTTSNPENSKKITMKDVVKKMGKKSDCKLYLLMGLGKKGLPSRVLDKSLYHLELTGCNVSLETCTAMGIIALQAYNAFNIGD